jgi:predicted DNA-binding transcriptional regulator YafY
MLNSIQSRALLFYELLKGNDFPNATILAKKAGCSRTTANRCIERLNYELNWPIAYESTQRGYYLTDQNFQPEVFSPGRDEFTALLLLREIAGLLDANDLQNAIDNLWRQVSVKNSNLSKELAPLLNFFSSDLTQIAILSDTKLFPLVHAAYRGDPVSLTYRSPWRHNSDKKYRGRIMKVHFSDGTLYVFLHEETGRGLVLNSGFIKELEILPDAIALIPLPSSSPLGESDWLQGFGVWASEDIYTVQIQILPPASHYYIKQKWHDDQEDFLDESGILTRSFPSMISPELARRILSIGKYVKYIGPEKLRLEVLEQAKALLVAIE